MDFSEPTENKINEKWAKRYQNQVNICKQVDCLAYTLICSLSMRFIHDTDTDKLQERQCIFIHTYVCMHIYDSETTDSQIATK